MTPHSPAQSILQSRRVHLRNIFSDYHTRVYPEPSDEYILCKKIKFSQNHLLDEYQQFGQMPQETHPDHSQFQYRTYFGLF